MTRATMDVSPFSGENNETIAETRVAVLHLARKAREDKQTALAKQLTEQGQVLKLEIAVPFSEAL